MNLIHLEELSCTVLGIDYDEWCDNGSDWQELDEKMYEKYGVDTDTFGNIADKLLEFVPPVRAEITGDLYQAFVKIHDSGMIEAIAKRKYKPSTEN